MFRVLSNQHYQHRANQKLRSWANAVFQNRGVCGQAFPSLPSPSPVIPFFFCSRPNVLDELARKRLLRRLLTTTITSLPKYVVLLTPKYVQKCKFWRVTQNLRVFAYIARHYESAAEATSRLVFDMHSAQIKTFKAPFTDKEITFFFR